MLFESIANLGIRAVALALRFFFTILMIRQLAQEEWGLFAYSTSIVTVFVFVVGMEFHTFAVRETVARNLLREREEIFCRHLRLSFGLGLVGAGVTLAIIATGRYSTQYFLPALGLLLLMELLLTEFSRYLRILKQNIQANLVSLLQTGLWFPFAYAMVNRHLTHLAPHNLMIACWMLGDAASILLCLVWLKSYARALLTSRTLPSLAWVASGLKCCWRYYGVAIFNQVRSQSDRLLIVGSLGVAALGSYAYYQYFANVMDTFIQTGFIMVYLPRILEAIRDGDTGRERRMVHELMVRSVATSLLLAAVILGCMPLVQKVIHKEGYLRDAGILPWLLLGQVLAALATSSHVHLYARRRDKHIFLIDLLGGGLVLGLNLILIPRIGLLGAAIAGVVTWLLIAACKFYLSARLQQQGEP